MNDQTMFLTVDRIRHPINYKSTRGTTWIKLFWPAYIFNSFLGQILPNEMTMIFVLSQNV